MTSYACLHPHTISVYVVVTLFDFAGRKKSGRRTLKIKFCIKLLKIKNIDLGVQ